MKKVLALCIAVFLISGLASAQIVISEVYEANGGSGKFVELHNQTGSAIDLSAGNWDLLRFSNGGGAFTIDLVGTVPANGFFVIGHSDVDGIFGAGTLDQTVTTVNHNGNDTYELQEGGATRDAFAGDNAANGNDFAVDVVAFRVGSALPNNGDWGDSNQPMNGATSTSGNWIVFDITAANANAVATATPGTSGGAGGQEVPVELSSFSIE